MAKRGRRKSRRFIKRISLKPETVQTIFFIFFLILSVISVFSFLQVGPVPTKLNLVLNQYFGFGSVFVPLLLLLTSFLFTKIKLPLKEPNVFLGSLIMFVSLTGLFQQGVVGVLFFDKLTGLFGFIPAFVILFLCFIAGFVILFDTSVAQIIKIIVSVFNLIKKYTVGNGLRFKEKKPKSSKNPLYIQSELDDYEDKSIRKKDDPIVIGIPPVLKSASTLPAKTSGSDHGVWQYPSIDIFDNSSGAKADRGDVRKNAQKIEETLDSFGITAEVVEVNNSPSVTQYALKVALGTKLTRIVSLSNDLAMALSAPGGQIRVEAPIPGRNYVGIEVPNHSLEVVPIRSVLESDTMKQLKSKIGVPLGLDVSGHPKIADIAKMPHVIIAGQTGSGKSVAVNSWISTLLFRASPEEVKLILVDPKRVELTPYNGIPHLLCPVIVDPDKVVSALKWATKEMGERFKAFTEVGVKNIDGYNNTAGFQSMPYIVIIIDELADIMLFSPAEVEENICRIAQMARAVGIHLVLATQRPSVNIITGLIKANVPTRIAFAVASMTDSRVILDTPGAEKLLGRGDMLYIPPELAKPVRIQGTFVSDREINRLIDFLKNQRQAEYNHEIVSLPIASPKSASPNIVSVNGEEHDSLFDQAVKLIQDTGKASTSDFQRKLKIGFARAGRLTDELERAGIVGPGKGSKSRDILIPHRSASDNS